MTRGGSESSDSNSDVDHFGSGDTEVSQIRRAMVSGVADVDTPELTND